MKLVKRANNSIDSLTICPKKKKKAARIKYYVDYHSDVLNSYFSFYY